MDVTDNPRENALQAFLLICPIGAYIGRVTRGIDMELNYHGSENTDITVKLIISREYSDSDRAYASRFVQYVRNHVETEWLKKNYPRMKIETATLDVTNREACTCWLIKELASFFKRYARNSLASVDLTSAPREWFFMAIDVSAIFPEDQLSFYNVPASHRSKPSSFLDEEIEDSGTRHENVVSGSLRHPLKYWLSPVDETGCITEHHILLRTMWNLRQNQQAYDATLVAKNFKAECLSAYDNAIGDLRQSKNQRKRATLRTLEERRQELNNMELEHVRKKISRFFSDIKLHKLFKESLGTYVFTQTGESLASTICVP